MIRRWLSMRVLMITVPAMLGVVVVAGVTYGLHPPKSAEPVQVAVVPKHATSTPQATPHKKAPSHKPKVSIKHVTQAPTPVPVAPPPAPVRVVVPAPSSKVNQLAPKPQSTTSSTSSSGSSSSSSSTVSYTSSNWAGYLATGKTYTSVSASWVVPSPSAVSGQTSYDATWIGIGGVTASDLIQTGTYNTVSSNGRISTKAFYEILPAASQSVLTLVVSPGDSMAASITETSPGQWYLSLSDETTGQSYTNTISYSSSHSSVEWIEEDPSNANGQLMPFDDFGSVGFMGASTVGSGTTLNLASAHASSVTMVGQTGQTGQTGQAIATPSAVNGSGTGFSVTYTAK